MSFTMSTWVNKKTCFGIMHNEIAVSLSHRTCFPEWKILWFEISSYDDLANFITDKIVSEEENDEDKNYILHRFQ